MIPDVANAIGTMLTGTLGLTSPWVAGESTSSVGRAIVGNDSKLQLLTHTTGIAVSNAKKSRLHRVPNCNAPRVPRSC